MDTLTSPTLKDRTFITGLAAIALSLLLFCFPLFSNSSTTNQPGFFLVNFFITIIYFVVLLVAGRLRQGRNGLYPLFLLLILFLISAYALNREMNVFEDSTDWFAALLVLLSINYIAFAFFDRTPAWVQHIMCFILGIALITYLYLSFYLVPLYLIGVVAALAIGISTHVFVPALFVIYTIVLIRRKAASNKNLWYSWGAGATSVIVVITVFSIQWAGITDTINTTYRKATAVNDVGLPAWVAASQKLERGWITERALKADLVYSVPDMKGINGLFWNIPSRNWSEKKEHDPLIMIAAFFGSKPNLSEESRIKILESLYDSRHQAEERLWSGENLITEHIETAVKLWPALGVSYTEKLIQVTNLSMHKTWGNQEEGVYTFHLPEGAVVTSLSLWIEGKEEKALLTTKEKANRAYREIVGYERRDPSLVQWKEGNTVSVRVFPVLSGESRQFKLGFTAPLTRNSDKLVYENVYFDGPSTRKTTEDVAIRFEQSPKGFIAPASFSLENEKVYTTSGKYKPDWKIELDYEPVSPASFSFNNKTYSVRPYEKQRIKTNFSKVYLDVNAAWTQEEFNKVYEIFKDKAVYVFDENLKMLSDRNRSSNFEKLHRNQFSLFPLYVITDPENSLLITKSPGASPNLSDLEDCRFMSALKGYLENEKKIKLFNIGNDLSPYLKSLKEYRVFAYEHGSVNDLGRLASESVFAQSIENDKLVVIDNADVAIIQTEGTADVQAPDHLMRLFAYNHIMHKMGTRMVTGDSLNTDLVDEAKEAYVVSPVSSLVVLESQADYDRYDIKETKNSLQNASFAGSGAVPEPHEWALIIIAVMTLLYLRFKPVFKLKQ